MPSSKNISKAPDPGSNKNFFYIFLILISMGVNFYFLFLKQDKLQQPLVKMNGQVFRWKDISAQSKEALARLDGGYYALLKREADVWVENQILPKEAQALSITVPDLLKKEVSDKTDITKDEIYKRYVQSPKADEIAWPQVLTDIENEVRGQQAIENKKKYMEALESKYGVQFLIKPPSANAAASQSTRFPVYQKPLSAAPVRGSAQAPVTMEVYSDFMCPFSVRFSSTAQELQRLYPDKVQVAFRHFPLPFHQGAHYMAEASMCAEEQGHFWEYHDKLMAEAKKREKPELVQIASDLGLNSPKFSECLDSGRYVKKVDEDIALGKSNGVQGTPGFLINGRVGSGAMPVDAMKPLIDWHLNPSGPYPGAKPKQQPGNQPGNGQPSPRTGLDPAKVYSLDAQWLKKGFARGTDSAAVTLVEFFDYNCPFCRKGAEVSDALVAEYGDKLKVVSKHYPLPMHVNAAKTAEALMCANEQSKFMAFRKEVLGDSWGKASVEDLKAVAKKVGLNESTFNACLDGGKMKAVIDEDMKMSSSVGVQSTPTFMINGTPVVGAQPIEAFKKVIDEKLAAKK